jgi:hypothetical protein
MPLHIPEGYFNVSLHADSTQTEGEIVLTFGIRDLTDQGPAVCASIIALAWEDDFQDFHHNSFHANRVHVTSEPPGPQADNFVDWNGTVSGDPAPSNCAALAKKVTGLTGKKFRGRSYFGGMPMAYVDGSNVDSTGITQLQAGCDAFLSALEAGDMAMVILHTSNSVPTPVVEWNVETRLATQRGRLRD